MLRLSPWVYRASGLHFAKSKSTYTGKKRRGNWLLWRRVIRVLPGIWVIDPRHEPLWCDEYGFEKIILKEQPHD